jgi:hypothetical protein
METSQESGHATTRHASLFRGFFHVRVLASGAIPSVSGSEPAQNKFRGISNHMNEWFIQPIDTSVCPHVA